MYECKLTHLAHGALSRATLSGLAAVLARFAAARTLARRQAAVGVLLDIGLEAGRSALGLALGVGRTGLGQPPAGLRPTLACLAGAVLAPRFASRFAPGLAAVVAGLDEGVRDAVGVLVRRPAGGCCRGAPMVVQSIWSGSVY